jgi:cephalosporin hydroxylase
LYSREAFEALSREWVRIGWALRYYHTFTWCGQPVLQLPEDLVRWQEVVASLRPDVVIETGIHLGGSLLFHATLCEVLGNGRVIGIDREVSAGTRKALTGHRLSHRIAIVEGDSTSPVTMGAVRDLVGKDESVMVILDSDHSCQHVAHELEAYAPLVTPGSCIVVADGIMCDLADVPGGEAGWTEDNPATAARHFLAAHPEFVMREPEWRVNSSPLRSNITYWPHGWLWKET